MKTPLHLLLLLILCNLCIAEEKPKESSPQYVQAYGAVEMREQIPYSEGMTLWDVKMVAKPHKRLWWKRINLKPEGSEEWFLFDFKRMSDELLEMKMKRIQIEPGDSIYFIEQVY